MVSTTLLYTALATLGASVVNAWNIPRHPPATTSAGTPIPTGHRDPHGLAALAERKHRYFGVAWDTYRASDTAYTQLVLAQFDQITPENSLKWESTEPSQGVFNFTDGDVVLKTTQANHFTFRAHCLVWHSQLPAWVTAGNFTKNQLINVMKNHIVHVAGHYKGKAYAWDVVNEVFNEDGTFRSTVFHDTIGPEFIDIAFQTAKLTDPFALLAINDYNIDGTGNKSTAMANLVRSSRRRGIPIELIGAQAHLVVGTLPTDIRQNWQNFANLGVYVAVTELDIRMNTPSSAADLQQQAKDYKTVINACLAVSKCIGITVWGAADKYSWVPDVFPGEGAPLPYDENLQPKPAYNATVQALLA